MGSLRPGLLPEAWGVGAREATAPTVPSTRPSDGGNGGLTHRGALSTSGSFRTSHTSRTLGRKEGDGEAPSPRGRAVGFWARVPSEPAPWTPESSVLKDAALSALKSQPGEAVTGGPATPTPRRLVF